MRQDKVSYLAGVCIFTRGPPTLSDSGVTTQWWIWYMVYRCVRCVRCSCPRHSRFFPFRGFLCRIPNNKLWRPFGVPANASFSGQINIGAPGESVLANEYTVPVAAHPDNCKPFSPARTPPPHIASATLTPINPCVCSTSLIPFRPFSRPLQTTTVVRSPPRSASRSPRR